MRSSRRIAAVLWMMGLASCGAQPDEPESEKVASSLASLKTYDSEEVCAEAERGPGRVRCMARRLKVPPSALVPHATPLGFSPTDLQSIYQLDPTRGTGVTVVIVNAMDDPNAESDLAVYRSQFNLRPCTSANGCFTKLNQDGKQDYPPSAVDWAAETSVDLDMVSAACPSCKIVLVEANSTLDRDMEAALNTAAVRVAAATPGSVISVSWGAPEDPTSKNFSLPSGVPIFACAGDSRFGAIYPATAHDVIAVGGTSVKPAPGTARGWSETVWNDPFNGVGTGSGCSSQVDKPGWQNDNVTYPGGCNKRMEVDVSAVADPRTGVAVYDSYQQPGWAIVGGTSASTPFVAAAFAMYQMALRPGGTTGHFAWTHPGAFFDVTSGSNGTCTPAYECTAEPGYDGPTGWGTPNGTAFTAGCLPECAPKRCGLDGCGRTCRCRL